MKLLINTPNIKRIGGVAKHYAGLKLFWTENVKYNIIGKRGANKGYGRFWLPWDILKFVFKICTFKPDIVIVNPSMSPNALKRDSIFLQIATVLNCKVAIFIHGFDWEYIKLIDKDRLANIFNKSHLIFVLGNVFKKELVSWGVTSPIEITTTKVDDVLLNKFDIKNRIGKISNLLFLARVEKAKGIYETLEIFELLKLKYPYLTLTVVGDGTELPEIKRYLQNNSISNVIITGVLSGQALIQAFNNADLYLFLSHSEGMPTSVLEAMAFGLPIFTRNVGGLPDFFENGKMGFITDSLLPQDFVDAIVPYIEDADLTNQVSLYNYSYAKKHFMASKVCSKIEYVLNKYID